MKTPTANFDADLESTYWELRAVFTDLFSSIDVDVTNPRGGARELGIDKNLTWKISRLIQAETPRESLINMPGTAGQAKLLAAAKGAGASSDSLQAVEVALSNFDDMVKTHCGSRETFRLILDSMSTADGRGGLEKSRKLAFQGNSGIWGLQTQVQLTSFFCAPSADGKRMDIALIGGMLGFRRLRPDATWPLFRHFNQKDDGTPVEDVSIEPLDPSSSGKDVFLIPEFCAGPVPEIRAIKENNATRYEFAPSQVGNAGSFSFVTGHVSRGAGPLTRGADGRYNELHAALRLPIKTLLMDVFYHRDLVFMNEMKLLVHGRLRGESVSPADRRDTESLPVAEQIQSLGERPPVPSTTLFPRYRELVELVYERAGWNARDFVGKRVVMEYPPIPSSAIIQAELPAAFP